MSLGEDDRGGKGVGMLPRDRAGLGLHLEGFKGWGFRRGLREPAFVSLAEQ